MAFSAASSSIFAYGIITLFPYLFPDLLLFFYILSTISLKINEKYYSGTGDNFSFFFSFFLVFICICFIDFVHNLNRNTVYVCKLQMCVVISYCFISTEQMLFKVKILGYLSYALDLIVKRILTILNYLRFLFYELQMA